MVKRLIVLCLVVAGLVGIAVVVTLGVRTYRDAHPTDIHRYRSDIKTNDRAKHHLVVFYDLKCPDCKQLHEDVLTSPKMQRQFKSKDVDVKLIPHPILSNNGMSNAFANVADSVNRHSGDKAYQQFIDIAYGHMEMNNPLDVMRKMKLPKDEQKQIEKDAERGGLTSYARTNKQRDRFNVKSTPKVYLDDKAIDFDHVEAKINDL